MTDLSTVDEETIAAILMAKLRHDNRTHAKFETYLRAQMGVAAKSQRQEEQFLMNVVTDWMGHHIAQRIKQNHRDIALISVHDIELFMPHLFKTLGIEIDPQESNIFKMTMQSLFQHAITLLLDFVQENENPYDHFGRWLQIVLNLGAQHETPTVDLLEVESVFDEIERRFMTREHYTSVGQKRVKRLEGQLVGTLGLLVDTGLPSRTDEEQVQVQREARALQIQKQVRDTIPIVEAWYRLECERIFGL